MLVVLALHELHHSDLPVQAPVLGGLSVGLAPQGPFYAMALHGLTPPLYRVQVPASRGLPPLVHFAQVPHVPALSSRPPGPVLAQAVALAAARRRSAGRCCAPAPVLALLCLPCVLNYNGVCAATRKQVGRSVKKLPHLEMAQYVITMTSSFLPPAT